MKSIGGELFSLAATLAIPAAIACLFPYDAVRFKAAAQTPPAPAAAFVTLNAMEESAAMRSAKASWQGSRDGAMNIRANLSFGELPQAREPSVLNVDSRTRQPCPADMEWKAPPCLPRLAAAQPQNMPQEKTTPEEPPFPRSEMLRLGDFGLGVR